MSHYWSPGCCPALSFRGTKIMHCAACHRSFMGIYAFDVHKLLHDCRDPKICGLVLRDQVWHWPANESLVRFLAKV